MSGPGFKSSGFVACWNYGVLGLGFWVLGFRVLGLRVLGFRV